MEEFNKMIEKAIKERDRLILKVLLGSGLRVSEVCNLKIKDIDF